MRLDRPEWTRRAQAHRDRVATELAEIVARRDRGQKHPVDDFLFHYYNLRPSHLAQWHPGVGLELADAAEFADRPFHVVDDASTGRFDATAFVAKRRGTIDTARRLLTATETNEPRFGCFGMHEWAMVHGLSDDETRHPYLKLRFEPAEIRRIVGEVGCRCSHFDAFRFFTPSAVPLNSLRPTRETQADLDQPGCLHVGMDLYKWAGKLSPAVGSELLYETFLLARDIRKLDMRASAYDLRDWGYEPVAVETTTGRAEYVRLQREFAARGAPLRRRLIEVCDALATTSAPHGV